MTRYAIVMGVSGCGKTSVGEGLSRSTGIRFVDGDSLHPKANVVTAAGCTVVIDNICARIRCWKQVAIMGSLRVTQIYRIALTHSRGHADT